MATDPDVERAARHLIAKHGHSTALDIARLQVRDLQHSGDVRAADIWKRIVDRLKELA